jgi:tetratricopeptide (TPR) repeat protein
MTRRGIVFCAAAVLLSGLVYLNALHNPFVYDDHRLIEENRSIVNVLDLRAIVLHSITRPLVNLSYAIDRGAWGTAPFGFHVTNVVLHMVNVLLLFGLVWRAMEDRARTPGVAPDARAEIASFTAAVLFAVHPMMTEAVGYISGRAELLSTMFVLGALISGREWMQTRNPVWKLLTFASWFCGLLSKETAVVLPLLLIWYGLVVRRDSLERRREDFTTLYLPLITIAAVIAGLRLTVFLEFEHPGTAPFQWRYAIVEADVVRRYLTLLLIPNGQTIFHDVRLAIGWSEPQAFMAVLVFLALVVLIWVARRGMPNASFGLFWFVVVLLPSAALVIFDRAEPMAEHRAYLAAAGLFVAAGAGTARMWLGFADGPRRARLLLRVAAGISIISLSGRTLIRNLVWSDPITLWSEAADMAPRHWLPALVLGESLHNAGLHNEAIVVLNRAVHLNPDEPAGYARLGVCLLEVGEVHAAREMFTQLQGIEPLSPEASNGLAAAALADGQAESAKEQFLRTLTFDPRNVEARRGLAVIAETVEHNPREALKRCEEIRALAPSAPGTSDCIERNRAVVNEHGPAGS